MFELACRRTLLVGAFVVVTLGSGCGKATKECQDLASAAYAVSGAFLSVEDLVRNADDAKYAAAKAALTEKMAALDAVESTSDALKAEAGRGTRARLRTLVPALVAYLDANRPGLIADENLKFRYGGPVGDASNESSSFKAIIANPIKCE